MSLFRSLLFVPGTRSDRFDKAAATGAQVIVDLEDAVAPDAKEDARAATAGWAGTPNAVVRINGVDSPWFEQDMALARQIGLRRLMVPKATPSALDTVRRHMGGEIELLALIETVVGLIRLRDICAGGGNLRLAFGNLDFALDAGISETAAELDFVRLQLTLESRFAHLPAPIDGVFPAWSDAQGLAEHVKRAKALGMGGKLCIHPAQVATVNEGWRPAPDELEWAARVLAAVEAAGMGAISVDGQMVDRPVVERAREIITSR